MHSINITYVFAEEVLLLFEQVMGPVRELDGDALIVQITGKSHFCRSCSTKMKTIQSSQSQMFRTIFTVKFLLASQNFSILGIYNKQEQNIISIPFHKKQAILIIFKNLQQWEQSNFDINSFFHKEQGILTIHNFPWSLGGWEVDGSCVGDISGCVHGVVCDPHVDVVPIPDQVQVPYIHQLKAVLQTMRSHVLQYVSDILCHVGTHWCVKEEMEFYIGWEMPVRNKLNAFLVT